MSTTAVLSMDIRKSHIPLRGSRYRGGQQQQHHQQQAPAAPTQQQQQQQQQHQVATSSAPTSGSHHHHHHNHHNHNHLNQSSGSATEAFLLRRRQASGDSKIYKGADIIRNQIIVGSASSSSEGCPILSRTKGSDASPQSILDMSNDEHIHHIYQDLSNSEQQLMVVNHHHHHHHNPKKSHNNNSNNNNNSNSTATSKQLQQQRRSASNRIEVPPPKEGFRVPKKDPPGSSHNNHSPQYSELSSVDISGIYESLEVVRYPSTPTAQEEMQERFKTGWNRQDSASSSLDDDDDIVEVQSHWDGNSVEIHEIQNNVYLLKPGDYNNDNSPIRSGRKSNRPTATATAAGPPLGSHSRRPQDNSLRNLRSNCKNSLLETEGVENYRTCAPQRPRSQTPDARRRNHNNNNSNKNSNNNKNKKASNVAYISSTSSSMSSSFLYIPSPLSLEYEMMSRDPGFRHAQNAGHLWQSLVGQHIRFPSGWWAGARGPPMGCFLEDDHDEAPKWAFYGRHAVRKNEILNQLVPSRASPGRLLLHIIVQDLVTYQNLLDVTVGCFHPNARGIRRTDRALKQDENSRDLWLAIRKRQQDVITTADRVLTRHSAWGEAGCTKSPLGPERRVTNHNVRAVFGENPPLETMILPESLLYERLCQRVLTNNVPPPLAILQEFVFA